MDHHRMQTEPDRQLDRCSFNLQRFQRNVRIELGRAMLAFRHL